MRFQVQYIRWLAKINYSTREQYGEKELVALGKILLENVPGLQCTWVHPRTTSGFSLMLRFFRGEIPQKQFFSPHGYSNWDFLNNDYQVTNLHFVRGWHRALLDFETGLQCKETTREVATRYQSLPGVHSVYMDGEQACRFTYQIILSFDHKMIEPKQMHQYHHWNNLNTIYGVVNVSHDLIEELKAVLEFEPGLYTHKQLTAIRNEYMKLPGIRFGWILGKRAVEISTIVLNFSPRFLARVPMDNYGYWNMLNKKFLANVTWLEKDRSKAQLRFPEGKYTDLQLKAILRKYRQLPGISSVRMDKQHKTLPNTGMYWSNSTTPKRSLKSWISMTLGRDDNDVPLQYEHKGNGTGWASHCIIY